MLSVCLNLRGGSAVRESPCATSGGVPMTGAESSAMLQTDTSRAV